MRKFAVATAAALAALAAPAAAQDSGEVRAEVRGGIIWAYDASEETAGAAIGYDFDLGETMFAGVEGSVDKVLVDGADAVFGVSTRLGTKTSDAGKLYATLGYTFENDTFYDAIVLGAGYEHKLNDTLYVGAAYRHFFSDYGDLDAATISLGAAF